RIVHVNSSPFGREKAGADLSARPECSVGGFPIDLKALCQAIRAARPDATVAFTATACCNRILNKGVGAPGFSGIELHLGDPVLALTLPLRQGNQRRMVLA